MRDGDWKGSEAEILEALRAEPALVPSAAKHRVLQRLSRVSPGFSQLDLGEGSAAAERGNYRAADAVQTTRRALGRPLAVALALVAATAAGASGYRFLERRVNPVTVHVPLGELSPPEALSPRMSAPTPEPATTSSTLPAPTVATEATAPLRGIDSSNAALGQALLERARLSFAHGDNEAALRAIAQHRRRYPKSALAEEREALTIRVLAATGQSSEAKARESRFVERYPQSIHLSAIRDALTTIP